MYLNRTSSSWNRTNRNEINANWETIETELNKIAPLFIDFAALDKLLTDFLNGNGVVGSSMLAADSVYGNIIRTNGIGTRHLLDGTVTNSKLALSAVSTDKISDYSVTESKLGVTSVTSEKLGAHAVTQAKIAPEAVTESKLGNRSVSSRVLALRSVTESHLEDTSVSTPKIGAHAVTGPKIADGAVTTSKIGNRAVQRDNIGLRSVGVRNTDFMTELRENLFIPQNIINNTVVNHSTGLLSSNSDYVTSEDIGVEPGVEYALSQIYYLVFKDVEGNVTGEVVASPITSLNTVTSPSNAATVQFSIKKDDFPDLNAFVFLRGSTYTLRSYTRNINHLKPETGSVSWDSTDFVIKSGEKVIADVFTDVNKSEKGWMAQTTNGTFVSTQFTEEYYHTDFLPIKPSSVIMRKFQRHIVYYDKNKIYITGNATPNAINIDGVTGFGEYSPDNAAYAVLNMRGSEELDEHLYVFNNDETSLKIPELVVEQHQIIGGNSGGYNPLTGKTGVAFGDSITQGGSYTDYISNKTGANYINVGFGSTRLARVDRPDYPWSRIGMCELTDSITSNDWTVTDAAIAEIDAYYGNTTYSTIYKRLKSIDFNNVDFITFMYGTNDANNAVFEIGASDSTDTYTVNGALNHILQTLITTYPHIKVYALSPIFRKKLSGWGDGDSDNSKLPDGVYLYDIAQAIVDKAKEYHTPVKDMYNESGINRYNADHFLKDGVHPSDKGNQLLNDKICKYLLSY